MCNFFSVDGCSSPLERRSLCHQLSWAIWGQILERRQFVYMAIWMSSQQILTMAGIRNPSNWWRKMVRKKLYGFSLVLSSADRILVELKRKCFSVRGVATEECCFTLQEESCFQNNNFGVSVTVVCDLSFKYSTLKFLMNISHGCFESRKIEEARLGIQPSYCKGELL